MFLQNSGKNTLFSTYKSKNNLFVKNKDIERFNRTYREDVLDMNLFENIYQVRELTDKFTEDYNQNHVHKSLANMTPLEFLNYH